jgi:hypothetical protein
MILEKYFDFLSEMNLPPVAMEAIVEATFAMIESINGMFLWKDEKPCLPLQINGKTVEEIAVMNKKEFKSFLDNIADITGQKTYLIEAFDTLVEMYSWTPSDAAQTYSVGGSAGAEVLQAPIRPMWDAYDPFKIAGSTTDAPMDQGGAPMGFGTSPINASKDDGSKYKYPEVRMNTSPDIKKIVGTAMNRIPHSKEAGFYAPWWQYNNFNNTQQWFT